MITIDKLDNELALKLGDPKGQNGDGAIFHSSTRLVYLANAIGRVYRVLPSIMRVYAPLFTSTLFKHDQDSTTSEEIILKNGDIRLSLENVKEVFISYKRDGKVTTSKATLIEPEHYLSILHDESSAYDPSIENKNIYYTFLNHSIYVLPKYDKGIYVNISVIMSEDAPELSESSELKIPRKYKDVILTYAALEGMEDLGRTDKVQLYTGDINNQLSILKSFADFKTMKEGSEVNG